jgi:hypothetical protein
MTKQTIYRKKTSILFKSRTIDFARIMENFN